MGDSLKSLLTAAVVATLLGGPTLAAEEVVVPMNRIDAKGIGKSIGSIKLKDSANGFLVLKLELASELPFGGHGFHVHENPSCAPAERDGKMVAGLAAGGHYDPAGTKMHMGPSGDGHLGDLPILYVEGDESGAGIRNSLVAPRLKLADVRGRALMIHDGSDNYRDEPNPLGGGGARIACGVIP